MTTTIIPENIHAGQNQGHFVVKGDRSQTHQVFFGDEERYPSCTCSYWTKLYLPCKHFCAIFQHVPGWSWDQLGAAYRDNPLFLLDGDVLLASDPEQHPQKVQQNTAEELGNTVPGDTGEESRKALTEEASGSKRPQRAAVTCKRLVRKNMDLLDKLESQVPHLKDDSFLEDMLKTLQRLVHQVQSIRTQGRKNAAATHRTSSRIKSKRKYQGDLDDTTEKEQDTLAGSELPQDIHSLAVDVGHLTGNNAATQFSQDILTGVNSDSHQVIAKGVQETSGGSQENVSHATMSLVNVNQHVQNSTSDNTQGTCEIRSDMIEAIVLNQNPYTSSYLPLNMEHNVAQGSQRTVAEHQDLQSNITFVTEHPVLGHQEILSNEGIIIQTVDQVDPANYIIDSTHQGVTVTVTNTNLDVVPSVT